MSSHPKHDTLDLSPESGGPDWKHSNDRPWIVLDFAALQVPGTNKVYGTWIGPVSPY